MDEIISQLSGSNLIESENHSEYYKYRGEDKHNQERRRLDLLKSQKEKRDNLLDNSRGILDLIREDENKTQYRNQHYNGGYKPRTYVPGFHKSAPLYADTLMLSEWMIEKPEDFETNWYALACPKGKRILIVASDGRTKAYLKYGNFYMEWKSCLPGGSNNESNKHCVLDCIISEDQIIYVLDVLAWGNISMTECEHEFRYFWLKSKFDESDFNSVTRKNDYSIRLIERCNGNIEELSKMLSVWPAYPDNNPTVDGLLFYHKKAFYVKNYTPLVVWLFPYMVNEVISVDIQVHNNYLQEKPADYVNNLEFIKTFELKLSNKKKKSEKYFSNLSSSRSSSSSSLNSSTESFGSGKVHYVFKANVDENKLVHGKKNNNKSGKKSKKPIDMDTDVIADVSVDSAVGFMDDSISNNDLQADECS